jgi:bromodomain-containing factor 1
MTKSSLNGHNSIIGLPKEQQRFCAAMIRTLKKNKDSYPFLEPVDPVKFNILDYPTVIKHPMDLGTVDKKLSLKSYASVDDFVSDVRLVFENCYKYNGPNSPISIMAQNLEKTFNTQLKNMPKEVSSLDKGHA